LSTSQQVVVEIPTPFLTSKSLNVGAVPHTRALVYASPKAIVQAADPIEALIGLETLATMFKAATKMTIRSTKLPMLTRAEVEGPLQRLLERLSPEQVPRGLVAIDRVRALLRGSSGSGEVHLQARGQFDVIVAWDDLGLASRVLTAPRRTGPAPLWGSNSVGTDEAEEEEEEPEEEEEGEEEEAEEEEAAPDSAASARAGAAGAQSNAMSDMAAAQAAVEQGVAVATLPPTEQVTAAADIPLASLTTQDWQDIYNNNGLLRGKVVSAEGKSPAEYPIYVFKQGSALPQYVAQYDSSSMVETYASKSAAQSAADGYLGVTAQVSTPWVSADASYNGADTNDKVNKDNESTTVQSYNFPRCKVWVDSFVDLNPACSADLSAALGKPTAQAKCQALKAFFQKYGQLVPQFVTLGGKMYNLQTASSSSNNSANAKSSSYSANASAGSVAQAAGINASVGVSGGNKKSGAASGSSASAKNNWSTKGGNSLLSGNPTAWTPTVAYPKNWGIIQYDQVIDFTQSPLFPADARAQLDELMTTPEYAMVFGNGGSTDTTAGNAILGTVQISDQSGAYSLSVPHGCTPGTIAFFRTGSFTYNTTRTQSAQVSLKGAENIDQGLVKTRVFQFKVYPESTANGSAIESKKDKKLDKTYYEGLSSTWTLSPQGSYVMELWGPSKKQALAKGTYKGDELIGGLGGDKSFNLTNLTDGSVACSVTLGLARSTDMQTAYEAAKGLANVTLWNLALSDNAYTLESVDNPGLYLTAQQDSTANLVVQKLSSGKNLHSHWNIYASGTQWAFINRGSLLALSMGPDKVYVARAAKEDLADPNTMTPTDAQAQAEVEGYAAVGRAYNSYSPASDTLLNVAKDMQAEQTTPGDPEQLLYCPCCREGLFDTFGIGKIKVPSTVPVEAGKAFDASKCYVQSVDPLDRVYNPPVVSSKGLLISVKEGKAVSKDAGLTLACCYSPTATSSSGSGGIKK